MTDLCRSCGHELPNAVGPGLYCEHCGEPVVKRGPKVFAPKALDPQRTREPTDRLTRLCDAMIKTLDAHPENGEDIKCCVFLDDGHRGGLVMHGYESDTEALADLIVHLAAIFQANGKSLQVIAMPEGPGQG